MRRAHLYPAFYAHEKVLWEKPSITGYLSSLFLVNEFQAFGFDGTVAGSNAPLWSLSFEATYYTVAGLIIFCRKDVWVPASFCLFGIADKTILALAPIWAAGFLLYKSRLALRINRRLAAAMVILTSALLLAVPFVCLHLPSDNMGHVFVYGRIPLNRNLLQDYLVLVPFIPHLVFAQSLLAHFRDMAARKARVIRFMGSLTFPLYLLHFPVLAFLAAALPMDHSSKGYGLLLVGITFLLVAILTPLTNRLKDLLKGGHGPAPGKKQDGLVDPAQGRGIAEISVAGVALIAGCGFPMMYQRLTLTGLSAPAFAANLICPNPLKSVDRGGLGH